MLKKITMTPEEVYNSIDLDKFVELTYEILLYNEDFKIGPDAIVSSEYNILIKDLDQDVINHANETMVTSIKNIIKSTVIEAKQEIINFIKLIFESYDRIYERITSGIVGVSIKYPDPICKVLMAYDFSASMADEISDYNRSRIVHNFMLQVLELFYPDVLIEEGSVKLDLN